MNLTRRIANELLDLLYVADDNYLYAHNKLFCYISSIEILDPKTNYNLAIYCVIEGPPDTPFENGVFKLAIKIPNEYPFNPPVIKFITPIYHPNLYSSDFFPLFDDMDWGPASTIKSMIIWIYSIMTDPKSYYTCNLDPITNMIGFNVIVDFNSSVTDWKKTAREWTNKHAITTWSVNIHSKYIDDIDVSYVKYLLWLGKILGSRIDNGFMDPWLMNIMPLIIGVIKPIQFNITRLPGPNWGRISFHRTNNQFDNERTELISKLITSST
jgi:ubiquitin-protein ligase